MIWIVLGTRPEMIKLAPVVQELNQQEIRNTVILTGQHPAVQDEIRHFGFSPQVDLHVRAHELNSMVTEVVLGLNRVECREGKPECVIVQGDTTSAFAAALWAFNNKVPVAHVEAGLRTHNLDSPYPEEGNRKMISSIATYHYAPTSAAWRELDREGHIELCGPAIAIRTGNTIIDAMNMFAPNTGRWDTPTVLVTLHRRESWGDPMIDTLKGLVEWLDTTDMQAVWPVHPGVASQGISRAFKHPRLIKREPYKYRDFIAAMRGARFLLTDSGGIQEEATALGKYTIVVRNDTERHEAITHGTARLVRPQRVAVREALKLAEESWANLAPSDVFGDGHAAKRIVDHLLRQIAS
jgi:UDP-N-acetylglucosamine 2-epimerase (non-hydrolysing)